MSDLQCPARLFLLRGDRAPAPTTVAALRGERVVAVYGAGDEAGSAVALRLAHELGTTLQPAAGLEELADRHRGEAAVVVGHQAFDAPEVLVEVDADGRRVVSWP